MGNQRIFTALWFLGIMLLIGGTALCGILSFQGWRFWTMRLQGTEAMAVVAQVESVRTGPVSSYRSNTTRTHTGTENVLTIVIPATAPAPEASSQEGMEAFFERLGQSIADMGQVPEGRRLERRACPDAVVDGLYPGKRVRVLAADGIDDYFLVEAELDQSPGDWLLADNSVISLGMLLLGAGLMLAGRRGRG